jgi:tetratricopeptide (TPR) repeat protein
MKSKIDHIELVRRGNRLHEARKYSAALPFFERSLKIAPRCPVASYCKANTLHMLDRDGEAYPILKRLVRVSIPELRRRCPHSAPESLHLDAYYLLFLVTLEARGLSREAFGYAQQHLRRRRRGLQSGWSAGEVRAEIAAKSRQRLTQKAESKV